MPTKHTLETTFNSKKDGSILICPKCGHTDLQRGEFTITQLGPKKKKGSRVTITDTKVIHENFIESRALFGDSVALQLGVTCPSCSVDGGREMHLCLKETDGQIEVFWEVAPEKLSAAPPSDD